MDLRADRPVTTAPASDDDILSTYQDHLPSADGHRIIRIHSTAKTRWDATRHHARIAKTIAAIDALEVRLATPRCRIEAVLAAEAEAREQVEEANATRWANFHVEQDTVEIFRQARRGRSGPNTAHKKIVTTRGQKVATYPRETSRPAQEHSAGRPDVAP